MESLSNFNFLKVFDVKKNNDKNANEKNLLSSEKSFIIDQVESIDNEFDNALSGQELNEDFVLLQKHDLGTIWISKLASPKKSM